MHCPAFVCLSVCLYVSNVTLKNENEKKKYHRCIRGQGGNDWLLKVIRIHIRIQEFLKRIFQRREIRYSSTVWLISFEKTDPIFMNVLS